MVQKDETFNIRMRDGSLQKNIFSIKSVNVANAWGISVGNGGGEKEKRQLVRTLVSSERISPIYLMGFMDYFQLAKVSNFHKGD